MGSIAKSDRRPCSSWKDGIHLRRPVSLTLSTVSKQCWANPMRRGRELPRVRWRTAVRYHVTRGRWGRNMGITRERRHHPCMYGISRVFAELFKVHPYFVYMSTSSGCRVSLMPKKFAFLRHAFPYLFIVQTLH